LNPEAGPGNRLSFPLSVNLTACRAERIFNDLSPSLSGALRFVTSKGADF
jgi:hypothetical protein